jgi:hypothetical protein
MRILVPPPPTLGITIVPGTLIRGLHDVESCRSLRFIEPDFTRTTSSTTKVGASSCGVHHTRHRGIGLLLGLGLVKELFQSPLVLLLVVALVLNRTLSSLFHRSVNPTEILVGLEAIGRDDRLKRLRLTIEFGLFLRRSLVQSALAITTEEAGVIDIVVFFIAEAAVNTGALIEEALVIHGLLGLGHGLAKGDLLANVTSAHRLLHRSLERLPTMREVILAFAFTPSVLTNPLTFNTREPLLPGLRGHGLFADGHTLLSGLLGHLTQLFLARLLLLDLNLLADSLPLSNFLTGISLSNVEGLAELRKRVANSVLLKVATIRSKTLVKRNDIALVVLPVRDTGRDLPSISFLFGQGARRGVHHGNWGSPWGTRELHVLELGRLHRVDRKIDHLDDTAARA